MNRKKLKKAPWYTYAVAACIAVAFYVLLIRLPDIRQGIDRLIGYFRPVILGCVIAYIVNPLSKYIARTIFKKVRNENLQLAFANALAFFIVIGLLVFFVMILVPQLIDSVMMFADNVDDYIKSIKEMLENWSFTRRFDISSLINSSESLIDRAVEYLKNNLSKILEASATAGKGVLQWIIAFILSIYLLANKKQLISGFGKLFRAMLGEKRYGVFSEFMRKCNDIFTRYIVFNLIDSLIIGGLTAIFMAAFGMQYVGLIAFVVAITNLVPTFGPVVGEVTGGFILLMVRPMHALIFVIGELIIQTLDGYVIKPKLFGNTLGVSGMWILIGIIVGGNMFGVVGILLAIPAVAVIDLVYTSYLMPWLEKRTSRKEAADAEEVTEAGAEGEIPVAPEDRTEGTKEELPDDRQDA